jgi:hypothetical protein
MNHDKHPGIVGHGSYLHFSFLSANKTICPVAEANGDCRGSLSLPMGFAVTLSKSGSTL